MKVFSTNLTSTIPQIRANLKHIPNATNLVINEDHFKRIDLVSIPKSSYSPQPSNPNIEPPGILSM
jgi:hypothetical protein